jgi:hypothetical protein
MKTQAILIAALALLLGTETALIKPDPETAGDLTGPAPNTRKILQKLGNYLLYQHNVHTGSILGEFNTLQFQLNSNNVLNV